MTAAPATTTLVARTVPLADPGPLLSLLPAAAPLAWVRDGEGLIGWGEAAACSTPPGPERFTRAQDWWAEVIDRMVVHNEVGLPGTGPVAFGSFAFADGSAAGGLLIVPEVIIGRRGDRWWLTTIDRDHQGSPERLAGAPGRAAALDLAPVTSPGRVTFRDGALTGEQWSHRVAEAVTRIGDGALEKVVLARDVLATTERPIDVRWLLSNLARRYPACWTFSVRGMVGATPEMLIRREKGLVTSRVLAGTIRRTGDDEHDVRLAAALARSSKDLEEHEYAVRSVVEALSPHCTSTSVPESPFVLHLPNVMHLATDVAGVLADDTSALGLAAALHPSAAVCGTPTDRAAALIDELEGMDRDRYAGPVGWLDATGDGEWGIALRSARLDDADPRRLRLFAGCGIVAGSDPAAELAETNAKLQPMHEALGSA